MSVKRGQSFLRFPAARCLWITDSLLLVIHQVLVLNIFYHCAFWAACMLDYFGFLCAAEFTVPNLASFSPANYLSVADISVDSLQLPACLCSNKSFKNGSIPSGLPHPYWSGKGTSLHSSGTASLTLLTRKRPWPLVPIRKWSTSAMLNPYWLAAVNFLH